MRNTRKILSKASRIVINIHAHTHTHTHTHTRTHTRTQVLSKASRIVSKANDAFYNAYEAADLKAMRRVWSRAPHVKWCVYMHVCASVCVCVCLCVCVYIYIYIYIYISIYV